MYAALAAPPPAAAAMRRSTDRNVLFVVVDDLRQQLAHTSPLEGEDTSFMVTRPFEPFDEEKECTPCAA